MDKDKIKEKNISEIIAGIDEAGRGAVIGPLVIAGVSIDKEKEAKLVKIGVKDSKDLSPKRREELSKMIEDIAKDIIVIKTAACKIDKYRKDGINLNRIETMKFSDILNYLNPKKAYIDCPDTNISRMKEFLLKLSKTESELIVEHKADEKYPVVSAASIVAKVTRDDEIEKLKKKYGDLGPGYPSNPITVQWLKNWIEKNKEFPEIVRKTWDTAQRIESEKKQSKLTSWFMKTKNDDGC